VRRRPAVRGSSACARGCAHRVPRHSPVEEISACVALLKNTLAERPKGWFVPPPLARAINGASLRNHHRRARLYEILSKSTCWLCPSYSTVNDNSVTEGEVRQTFMACPRIPGPTHCSCRRDYGPVRSLWVGVSSTVGNCSAACSKPSGVSRRFGPHRKSIRSCASQRRMEGYDGRYTMECGTARRHLS